MEERKKMVVAAKPGADAAKAKTAKVPETQEVPRVDEALMKPGKYEVQFGQTFDILIHLKLIDGRWLVMNGPGPDVDSHKVTFRMWTYDEMVNLKKRSTNFDTDRRVHMIDNDMLNRLKVQSFLMSWTLGTDNARLKLHHVQSVLTDESWDAFRKLQPNILNHIFEEMNKVYEWNG